MCIRDSDDIVLAVFYLHAVRIAQAEPLFGNLSDLVAALTDGVLVVEDVTLHLQIGTIPDLYYPAVAQRGDQGFLNQRQTLAARPFNLHRILDTQHASLDFAQLAPGAVFKKQRVAHTQHLAIYFECPVAVLIFDPEIIAK
jgi:hypothetical protein